MSRNSIDLAPNIEIPRFAYLSEFVDYRKSIYPLFNNRQEIESKLISQNRGKFYLCGHDPYTLEETQFEVSGPRNIEINDVFVPHFRETLVCKKYKINCRLRATSLLYKHLVKYRIQEHLNIYLTEQVTPFFNYCKSNYTYSSIEGSEYLGTQFTPGEIINDVRHEDLTNLSFPDGRFDIIFCLEVMEHIPDFINAFKEIYRCLNTGGVAIFSAPFTANKEENTIRATMNEEGQVEHLMEPEYHGDPVNQAGILCFQYYGWDVLKILRKIGFIEANVVSIWSYDYGILGGEQLIWYAKK